MYMCNFVAFNVTIFVVGLYFYSLGVIIYNLYEGRVYQHSLRVLEVTGCKLNSPYRE